MESRGDIDGQIVPYIPLSLVSLRIAGVLTIAETEQLYQVKRMVGGIGNISSSTYSQTSKWARSSARDCEEVSDWAVGRVTGRNPKNSRMT